MFWLSTKCREIGKARLLYGFSTARRDEVYFTTLLCEHNGLQNDLISRKIR